MADGVIGGKDPKDRGLDEPLDWYRNKAELMRFLGMNTYTKDLLEFGACQHWDSSPYGGNKWVYFNSDMRGLWARIVELMGTGAYWAPASAIIQMTEDIVKKIDGVLEEYFKSIQ